MKSLLVVMCGLMVGCASEVSENLSESSSDSLTVDYSLREVACTNPFPSNPLRIKNRSVDLQIDSTVDSYLVDLHVQAFDFWGIKVNSVTFTNPNDSYQEGKLVLANCQHASAQETIAYENGFGTALNYPELFPKVAESVQLVIMIHEIGHVIGLSDSNEWSLMNGSAGYAGAETVTPAEWQLSQNLLDQ